MQGLAEGEPIVVISPHLDDAVFSCGQLLAAHPGSVVITAMAGWPAAYPALTPWDAAGGFRPGDDVVAARRAEDRAALDLLAARPVWLEFVDSQYGCSPIPEALVAPLEAAIVASALAVVLVPLGLFHSDHALTHTAALAVLRRRPALRWFAYEEPNYRRVPNLLAERLAALRAAGIAARFAGSSGALGRAAKRRAAQRYRSQLRALAAPGYPGYDDVFAAERYWRLALSGPAAGPAPRGAGGDGR